MVATDYAVVAVFAAVGIAFIVITLFISRLFRPNHPNAVKREIYECGNEPVGSPWVRFNFRYYIFALLFLLFDVETAFIFPWAVRFKALGVFATVEMFVFIAILAYGLIYTWRKGLLEWQ